MVYALSGLFLYSLVLTLALVPAARALARRRGWLDVPGGRKAHDRPVPFGGGLAVAGVTLFTLASGALVLLLDRRWGGGLAMLLPPDVRRHVPGMLSQLPRLAFVLAGGAAILALGFVDDLRPLSPRQKLAGQCVVIGILAAAGDVRLSVFSEGEGLLGRLFSIAVTLGWCVAVINAFNLLDHMDGVCAGVAATSSAVFLVVALQLGHWFVAGLLLIGIGTCLGFLAYNWPPATVFLGDAGSQFIGYMLAVTTVLFTFYEPPYPLFSYFVPVVVLAVPLYDMVRVVGLRIAARRSPFAADLNHLAHRLVRLGCSARQALGLVILLTGVTGLLAVLLYDVGTLPACVILGQVVLLLVIVSRLETIAKRKPGAES